MFRGTLSLTQENHNFIVQIGKNKAVNDKIWSLFSGKSNILKFLLSPVRFTKHLGVRVPLRPPRKKALAV
jgi:hypothetical protein